MHVFKKTSKHLNKDSLDVVMDFLSDEKMEVNEAVEENGSVEDIEMEDS
jgi:hypothetical protein